MDAKQRLVVMRMTGFARRSVATIRRLNYEWGSFMRTSYKMLAVASAGYIFVAAGSAQAAVTVDGYSLDTGSFGTGLGVHSTGTQSGTTLNGIVNTDGSAAIKRRFSLCASKPKPLDCTCCSFL